MKRKQVERGGTVQNASSKVPVPFLPAAGQLEPFLQGLNPSHVYIVHVDRMQWRLKRQVFIVPVILNLVIAALILWRWYAVIPTYIDLILIPLGQKSKAQIDPTAYSKQHLVWLTVRRTAMLILDYLIIKIILPWPLTFFFESPGNPVSWRRSVGFQDEEIIVRISRGWNAEDISKGQKQGSESPFFKTRILPAIEESYIRGKTGYLMMGKDWDLDFAAMTEASELVRKKDLVLDDFKTAVLVHVDGSGWCIWRTEKSPAEVEEEGRRRIVAFKDRLTAMGKESLFFRYIELMQYESTTPGDWTSERSASLKAKAKETFSREGVDLEEVLESIGGLQTMLP